MPEILPPTRRSSPLPRRFLRRSEAANYVQNYWGYPLSAKTLAKYAVVGGGPKFCKASRFPLYEAAWLDEWVRSKLSLPVSSTSELPRPAK
jgi:hypothetical protein